MATKTVLGEYGSSRCSRVRRGSEPNRPRRQSGDCHRRGTRHRPRHRAAAGGIGGAIALEGDVTEPAMIEAALAATERQLGPSDILINNAGISGPNHPLDEY